MKAASIGLLAGVRLAGVARVAPDSAAMASIPLAQIPCKGGERFGSQIYVMWGDPMKPGPYAMLVKWLTHHMSQPHTHPTDRHALVVSGAWWVGTGKTYSPDTNTPLPAGTVVTHFAKQFHFDGAKDEPVILEIVGEGPQ